MLKGTRESGEISEQEQDGPGHRPVERAATAPGRVGGVGSPTWQSIMVSSSFSSIFFSPVSAHRRASRTGPSGRPPSFFSGASQSKDKTTAGRRGVRWRTCPWRRTQTAQVGESCSLLEERGFPTLNQQQTQILNHPYLSQYFHTS